MRQFELSLALALIFPLSSFAAETACGKLLAADPHFHAVDHALLDLPVVQDLLTLRRDRLRSAALVVGARGYVKTALLDAMRAKAASVGIPTAELYNVRFEDDRLIMNLAVTNGDSVTRVAGTADQLIATVPSDALVTVDWTTWDLMRAKVGPEPKIEGNLDVTVLIHMLGFAYRLGQSRNAFVIQTSPTEAFREFSKFTGPSVYDAYAVIDLDRGGLVTAGDEPRR